MTKQDLSYHVELKKQLAADLELLASMEAAAGPRVQHLDGMPHASGVRDVVGDLAAEIADLKTEISELLRPHDQRANREERQRRR